MAPKYSLSCELLTSSILRVWPEVCLHVMKVSKELRSHLHDRRRLATAGLLAEVELLLTCECRAGVS